ncbi:MAG: hypothetical protein GY851_35415 [bacterium]|nr:hypothetical protein [bacterium]
MAEHTHTPGPYEVKNLTDVFGPLGGDSGDGMAADPNDGWLVADCSAGVTFAGNMETELGFDVQKANARLLATAPDMLAMLEDVACRIIESENWWMDCPDRGGFDLDAIQALIAKATGATDNG